MAEEFVCITGVILLLNSGDTVASLNQINFLYQNDHFKSWNQDECLEFGRMLEIPDANLILWARSMWQNCWFNVLTFERLAPVVLLGILGKIAEL